jgi:hypothetical protein
MYFHIVVHQVDSIEDAVQKICQNIRDMKFDLVSEEQKKDCKKRNLIKEELVIIVVFHTLLKVIFLLHTVVSG